MAFQYLKNETNLPMVLVDIICDYTYGRGKPYYNKRTKRECFSYIDNCNKLMKRECISDIWSTGYQVCKGYITQDTTGAIAKYMLFAILKQKEGDPISLQYYKYNPVQVVDDYLRIQCARNISKNV